MFLTETESVVYVHYIIYFKKLKVYNSSSVQVFII